MNSFPLGLHYDDSQPISNVDDGQYYIALVMVCNDFTLGKALTWSLQRQMKV